MDAARISCDWTAREYDALPAEDVARMGLRAWSLHDLRIGSLTGSCRELPLSDVLPPDIQADGLRARYGSRKEVLKGLSFSATGGHAIAVVGRNGQGKSTLARIVAGLMRETYGGISVNARPLGVSDRAGNIYLVLQESGYQLFGASVRGEFAIGMEPPDEADEARIDNLIERFDLVGKEEWHPASLSGGEKQRLALAVGVYAGAELLVLDEPTSGLDLANMRRCASEIRRLADSGRCVFVITHDAELVTAACDRIIEIADGRVKSAYELTGATLPRTLRILAPDLVSGAWDAAPRGS
jgi:energy-coupling factor transport system ATP-binding protein